MVHEIRQKSLFQIAKNSAKEIGYRTLAQYAFLGTFIIVIAVTFILSSQRQTIIQSASYDPTTRTFIETFDGDPAAPKNFTQLEQPNWDVQVHSRDRDVWKQLDAIDAQHGHDCSAPPASHPNDTYEGSVFNCKNHIMTSLNAGGYGVIYLTSNHMADFQMVMLSLNLI